MRYLPGLDNLKYHVEPTLYASGAIALNIVSPSGEAGVPPIVDIITRDPKTLGVDVEPDVAVLEDSARGRATAAALVKAGLAERLDPVTVEPDPGYTALAAHLEKLGMSRVLAGKTADNGDKDKNDKDKAKDAGHPRIRLGEDAILLAKANKAGVKA